MPARSVTSFRSFSINGNAMDYLEEIDYTHAEFGDIYDELPLWSAPFGLLLLERVPIKNRSAIVSGLPSQMGDSF